MSHHSKRIQAVAKKVFNYSSLRPGQEEAISSILDGHDTLVIMPTGGGKSAIYQISALLIDGPTLVISPLIALQKDQSERLNTDGPGGAAVVNSLVSTQDQKDALADVEQGQSEFLFLAPEQFSNPERLASVQAAKPSLFVVDEAHCVSEWGHSFRPDYLRLGNIIEELGHPRILALTATANEAVRAEIVNRLGMRQPKVFVHGFDRPNIWFGVETAASEDRKRAMLLDRVRNSARPGIVYASTRRHAQQISDELNNVGIRSALYHAGLKKRDREAMQEQFMADQVEVIVATSAFGMGVDKPNVRFVFHYDPPDSLDSYYQEVGRAGRDGEAASTILFYLAKDLGIHKFFKGTGQIRAEDVQRVIDALEGGAEMAVVEVQKAAGLSKIKTTRALSRLEECGAVVISTGGTVRLMPDHAAAEEIAAQASQAQSELHDAELARIEQMRQYAENLNCRRAYLLSYFGEPAPENCGNCDNCLGAGTERAQLIAETRARTEAEEPEALLDRVG